jgi:hypothetical protein
MILDLADSVFIVGKNDRCYSLSSYRDSLVRVAGFDLGN